jgi:calcineurin-like phosphoesterase family protein
MRGIRWTLLLKRLNRSDMSETFFISDTHFDHDAIRMHCNRPWSDVDSMNQAMLTNWNSIVGRRDSIIIGGDFAWKRHAMWASELHGCKTLVFGNHDHMPDVAQMQFARCVGKPKESGILQLHLDGKCVVICHYPMWSWNASFHGSWHLYGHAHGRKLEQAENSDTAGGCDSEPSPRMQYFENFLACAIDADVWNWTPIPWEVLKAKLDARVERWKARRDAWARNVRDSSMSQPIDTENSDTMVQRLAAENARWRARCT